MKIRMKCANANTSVICPKEIESVLKSQSERSLCTAAKTYENEANLNKLNLKKLKKEWNNRTEFRLIRKLC